jgi:hypothetical protein
MLLFGMAADLAVGNSCITEATRFVLLIANANMMFHENSIIIIMTSTLWWQSTSLHYNL